MKLNLVGGAYSLDNIEIDCQTCINWYAQAPENGGGQSALIPTAGLVKKYTLNGPIKGMYAVKGSYLIIVAGNTVYASYAGAFSPIGTIEVGSYVTMAFNGLAVVIATGTKLYSIDATTGILAEVIAEGFNGCQDVGFIDGRFIFSVPNSGQYGWFGLYNLEYDALNFATAEGSPDKIMKLITVGSEVWMLGEYTTEVYYNTGNADLPFRRVGGAFIPIGCVAPQTVVKMGGSLVFIAKTEAGGRQVCMTQGYQAQRISTHVIEQALTEANVKLATAFAYQQSGHGFYVLNLPDINRTFVFDVLTALWHERAHTSSTGALSRYRGQHHAYDGSDNLIGDYQNGNIYALKEDVFTDDGFPVYRERTLPYFPSEKKNVSYMRLELEMSVNASLTQHSIDMSWSDDYARTWSTPMPQLLGAQGMDLKRVVWRRLGIGRQRTYKFTTTANSRCALINGYLEVQGSDR